MRFLLWLVLLQVFRCSEGNIEIEKEDEKGVTVEILVIVDEDLNAEIASLNMSTIDYVRFMLSCVNMFYSNIRPKIQLTISNILIENVNFGPLPFIKPLLDPPRLDYVSTLTDMAYWNFNMTLYTGPTLLQRLLGWFEKPVWFNTANADVVVALTGLNLCSFQKLTNVTVNGTFHSTYHDCSSVAGGAYHGTACDQGLNVAIVQEDSMDFFVTAYLVAHEIGHLLNLTHDGKFIQNEMWCNASDKHMMSPIIYENDQTRLKFAQQISNGNLWSECSKEHFRRYLTEYECLKNKPEEDMYPLWSPCFIFKYLLKGLGLRWNLDGWSLLFGYDVQCMWSTMWGY